MTVPEFDKKQSGVLFYMVLWSLKEMDRSPDFVVVCGVT
jgi:hypothetical protein